MAELEESPALRAELRAAWHRYVDLVAPLRPALHGYCRRLTGNLWDAEDLVQDTLLRVFGQWGVTHPAIRDPRAYLLRAASNIWIDRVRRSREIPTPAVDDAPATGADLELSVQLREAGSALLQHLAPQERAALMLKEAFDMPLDEIAALLATSTGAVKSALHRGRERLRAPAAESATRPRPSAQLVDRFIERFSAKDVAGLIALMLDGASAENVGNSLHAGDDPEQGLPHFFYKVVHGHEEWPAEAQWDSSRMQRAEVGGESVALCFVTRGRHEALAAVMRFEEDAGRIARIRSYGFCPEVVRAVGEELGVRVLTGLYRAPSE
jgi:RNA polymerase sigma-70 factor (ECF subfamily)